MSATYIAMDSAATPTPTAVPTEAPTPAPTVYYRLETTTNPISVAARIRVKTKYIKTKIFLLQSIKAESNFEQKQESNNLRGVQSQRGKMAQDPFYI